MNNRRSFIRQAGLLAGSSILASVLDQRVYGALGRKMAPGDRINIGAIGINGMGLVDLKAVLKQKGVQVVMLCDIEKNILDKRIAKLAKQNVDISKIKT